MVKKKTAKSVAPAATVAKPKIVSGDGGGLPPDPTHPKPGKG